MENKMEKVNLFDDFYYGMTGSKIKSITSAKPDARNRLILQAPEPVRYLDLAWHEQFFLNNQDELQQIVLVAVEPVSVATIAKALQHADWQPIFLETEDYAFDRLQEANAQGKDHATELVEEFIRSRHGSNANCSISFLPATYADYALKNGMDFNQAVDSAGENFVAIRLMATEGDLKLSFTAPLLSRKNALRYGQIIRRQ